MAYTLTFTTNNVSLYSEWKKNGSTVISHATTDTATRTIAVSGLPNNAIIQSANVSVQIKGSAAYGTNFAKSTLNGTTVTGSGSQDSYNTNIVPITVSGNGDVTLTFVYQANEDVGVRTGTNTYSFTADYENITLTITYALPGPPTVTSGWYTCTVENTGTSFSGADYVVGQSKIKVDFNPSKVTVATGASISSFSITYNGTTQTGAYSSGHVYLTTTAKVTGTSSTITLNVTDSNGLSTTATATISAYAYSQPTITGISVYRSNSSKTASETGTYITAKATANFTALGSWNTCTLTAKYKPQGGSYGAAVTLANNTATLINSTALSATTTYIVRLEATDRAGNTASYETTIYATVQNPPTVSSGWYALSPYNTGTKVAGFNGYIVGYSKVQAVFDPSKVTCMTGATIASFSITYNGATTTGAYSSGNVTIRSGTVSSESSSITLRVTDSNGKSTTATATISAYAYSPPTLSNISVYRSDSNKQAAEDGAYITAKATATFPGLGGNNYGTLTAQYRTASASSFGSAVTLTSGTAAIINSSVISTTTSYVVRITATDRFGTTATYDQTVYSIAYPLHIKNGGTGIAFGKTAETNNLVDSAWDMRAPVFIANGGFQTGSMLLRAGSQSSAFIPNLPSGVSYGRVLKFGGDSTSTTDRYYMFLKNPSSTAMRFYIGYQSASSSTVRWFMFEANEVT